MLCKGQKSHARACCQGGDNHGAVNAEFSATAELVYHHDAVVYGKADDAREGRKARKRQWLAGKLKAGEYAEDGADGRHGRQKRLGHVAEAAEEEHGAEGKGGGKKLRLGGEDGLDFYRRIIQGASAHLCGGGDLVLEIGADQAEDVMNIMKENRFIDVKTIKDYGGNDRVVRGILSSL